MDSSSLPKLLLVHSNKMEKNASGAAAVAFRYTVFSQTFRFLFFVNECLTYCVFIVWVTVRRIRETWLVTSTRGSVEVAGSNSR